MTSVLYSPVSFRGAGRRWWSRGAPIAIPAVLYAVSLGAIIVGYYAYWIIWKLKAYYIGWTVALVAAVVFAVFFSRDTKGLFKSLWPIFIWEGYIALSVLWAPDPQTSLYFVGARAILPMAFVIGYIWARNLSTWQLSSYLPITALLQIPIMLWTLITIGQLYNVELGAVRTGLVEATLFAVPFLAWRARARPTYTRYLLLATAMLVLAASGSRTGLVVGVVVLVGTFVFTQPPSKKRSRMLVKTLFALLMLGGLGMTIPQVRTGFSETIERLRLQTEWSATVWFKPEAFFSPAGEQPADRDRRLQMLVVMRSFMIHPIRGNGYSSTYSVTKETTGVPISAHGIVALVLGEIGVVGGVLFVWLVARFFRRVGRAVKHAQTIEARGFWVTCIWTMIAMLLLGLFHQTDQDPNFYILLSWGFAAKYPHPSLPKKFIR